MVGELAEAARAEGLVFGVPSHRAEHWWFFNQGMTFDSDVRDPKNAGPYGPDRAARRRVPRGLVGAHCHACGPVQLVWFDRWSAQLAFHPYLQQFAAYCYNRGAEWKQGVAINYKKHGGESFPDDAGVLDIERVLRATTLSP